MDVILHLGAHRCATTTLQRFLARNDIALGDAGVANWGPGRTRAGLFSGLIQRPGAVTPAIARRGMRSCGIIALEIDRLRQGGFRDLVVSDENMLGTVRGNLADGVLYPDARARLDRFVAGFGPNPRRIGLGIRSYDTFWASSLAYATGKGAILPSPQMIASLPHQSRRWREVIEDIAQVFPRSDIVVWPFERFAGLPEAQLGFLTGGLSIPQMTHARRDWLNASPDRAALRRILPKEAQGIEGAGAYMPFDAKAIQTMRDSYAEDLEWLRTGTGGLAQFFEAAPPTAQTIITSAFSASDRDTKGPSQGGSDNDTEQIVV